MVYHWGIPLNIIEGVYSKQDGVGVRSKLVDFETLNMDGKPFTEAIEHVNKNKLIGVPCEPIPYCSEYLKTRPSHDFAREIFGSVEYVKAIGYRAEDVPKRITFAELREDTKRIAPLLTDLERPVNKYDLTEWFSQQPFQLSIPSDLGNCEVCWKKSKLNLIKAIRYGTRFIEWHKQEEEKYGNRFFRDNLSITDLVKMAETFPTQLQLLLEEENQDDFQCVCIF